MRIRYIIIVSLATLLSSNLFAKEIKVDYKDLTYTVKQDSKNFIYKDKNIKKEYVIKKCNQKQFEIFWALFENNKNHIASLNKVYNADVISLKEDDKNSKINPHGKFGNFLISVPKQITALDINEKSKCSK